MKDENRKAFENLITDFSRLSDLSVPSGIRYIKTTDFEKEWLRELKVVSHITIYPAFRCLLIEFRNENFIVVIGEFTDDVESFVAEEMETNAGLITVLLAEDLLSWKLGFSALEIFENVLSQHMAPNYSGHDSDELEVFLERVHVYKIHTSSVLSGKDIFRISSYFVAVDNQVSILEFDKRILELYADIALQGADKISYQVILDSLTSSSYKHAFIEVYRLIERLFPINYLKELHQFSQSPIDFFDFVTTLETSTGWRPKEDEALAKLFDYTNPCTVSMFEALINSYSQFSGLTPSNFVYKLRNSIVHFRGNNSTEQISDTDWNNLLEACLYFVDQHYTSNDCFL